MKIPFFRTIRFKLISSFLVSVICIVVLGVASYRTASSSMIKNYKNSSQQTVEMMQQYLNLIISSEKNEYKQYLKDEQFTRYISNVETETAHLSTKAKLEGELQGKKALDDKIGGVYFLRDKNDGIYVSKGAIPENAYSAYIATPQGAPALGHIICDVNHGQLVGILPGQSIHGVKCEVITLGIGVVQTRHSTVFVLSTPDELIAQQPLLRRQVLNSGSGFQLQCSIPLVTGHDHGQEHAVVTVNGDHTVRRGRFVENRIAFSEDFLMFTHLDPHGALQHNVELLAVMGGGVDGFILQFF